MAGQASCGVKDIKQCCLLMPKSNNHYTQPISISRRWSLLLRGPAYNMCIWGKKSGWLVNYLVVSTRSRVCGETSSACLIYDRPETHITTLRSPLSHHIPDLVCDRPLAECLLINIYWGLTNDNRQIIQYLD